MLLQVEEALPEQHRNELIEALIEVVAALTDECTEQAIPQPQQQRQRGRPRASISEDQLVYLLEHSFSQVSIARMLGCSSRTIHRRIEELGLDGLTRYTNIDDSALDRMIAEVVKHFPNWGVKSIQGHLVSRQLRVQRSRVRESLRRVDAEGVEARCRRSLHRRVYSVPHPNSLWHIDGYHKLIRYHIVIHGGIDGFSRTIVYLKASDNNRAETVYEAFQNATRCFGIPSRVRSDYGGENVKVARFMIEQRGTGRGSMITGRSVHNQRIERLWRDLFTGCISIYYYLFRSMEEDGLLDCDDSTALYALHYIFLPRINRHLQLFTESWNNHPLRTQRNQTPMQLWISGILGAPHELYVIQVNHNIC